MRQRLGLPFAIGALVIGAAGCSPDPHVTYDYAKYEGTAYPNRAPKLVWPAGDGALITNSYSDSVSAVDALTSIVFATRPVGRNPIDLDGPHHIAADPSRHAAFTALSYPPSTTPSGPHAAHGSSSIPGYVQKISLDDLSITGAVRVENNPGDVVISDDKKRLVVSHFDLERATKNPTDIDAARADLALIDPDQVLPAKSATPTFIPVCVVPHGVALSKPDGKLAYVACYGEDKLAIVNLDDPTAPVVRVDMGPGVVGFGAPSFGPYAAILSPDEKEVVVTDTESNDVRFFDIATQTFDLDKTLPTLGAPYFPKFGDDGKTLYVPTQLPDAIYAFDTSGVDEPILRTFTSDECQLPHIAERAENKIFLICEGDHKTVNGKLLTLDPADLSTITTTELGLYPDAFAVIPGGSL